MTMTRIGHQLWVSTVRLCHGRQVSSDIFPLHTSTVTSYDRINISHSSDLFLSMSLCCVVKQNAFRMPASVSLKRPAAAPMPSIAMKKRLMDPEVLKAYQKAQRLPDITSKFLIISSIPISCLFSKHHERNQSIHCILFSHPHPTSECVAGRNGHQPSSRCERSADCNICSASTTNCAQWARASGSNGGIVTATAGISPTDSIPGSIGSIILLWQ